MEFPPSPALSACDSLDGVDLDAFLEKQGSLSHFPTPPLKPSPMIHNVEIAVEDNMHSSDYAHIATTFADEAGIDIDSTPDDIESIRNMLIRADLPLEIIAVAFNILSALHARVLGLNCFNDTPPDLLVVAALSLAVSYNNDTPPRTFWWSHRVCDCAWTTKRIDRIVLKLFAFLGFEIYQYSDYDHVRQTTLNLLGPSEPEPTFFDAETNLDAKQADEENQSIRLLIDDPNSGYWINGQLTPEASRPSSANSNKLGLRTPLFTPVPVL